MNIEKQELKQCLTLKFIATEEEEIMGVAYLHVIYHDNNDMSYGLLADVKVEEKFQKNGVGTELVKEIIEEAKRQNCKWLVGTSRYSRPHVHKWYEKLGFIDRGKEFRIDF